MLNRIVTLLTAALVGLTLTTTGAAAEEIPPRPDTYVTDYPEYRLACVADGERSEYQTRMLYNATSWEYDAEAGRWVDVGEPMFGAWRAYDQGRYCYAEKPVDTSSRHTEYRKRRGVLQQRFVTVLRTSEANSGLWLRTVERDVTKWHRAR